MLESHLEKYYSSSMNIIENKDYAVGWLTLALINAGLAQSKGYRGSLAFFVSLILGPIATLILVCRSRKTEK